MTITEKLLAAFILLSTAACQKNFNTKDNGLTPDGINKSAKLKTNGDGPTVIIVSPSSSAKVARGEGRVGAGSFNGAGFLLNLEVVTHDEINVTTKEGLNIRNTALLGSPNPNMPGLKVFFDCDLIKPDQRIPTWLRYLILQEQMIHPVQV